MVGAVGKGPALLWRRPSPRLIQRRQLQPAKRRLHQPIETIAPLSRGQEAGRGAIVADDAVWITRSSIELIVARIATESGENGAIHDVVVPGKDAAEGCDIEAAQTTLELPGRCFA